MQQAKVRVLVRLRPPSVENEVPACEVMSSSCLKVDLDVEGEERAFNFEQVFDKEAKQAHIFAAIRPVVDAVFDGYNSSIFAFGATGTGKTFTMEGGSEAAEGVIPRALRLVTSKIQQMKGVTLKYSHLEIYNEKIRDLLDPKSLDLPIRENQQKEMVVHGLTEVPLTDFTEFQQRYSQCCANRVQGATKLNVTSSRSHSIVMIKVLANTGMEIRKSKLHLIDLAGSEDNRKTGNVGGQMVESTNINMSLFNLFKVIDALNARAKARTKGGSAASAASSMRIPYRDSKLTRLLQDSLGGSSFSTMIVALSSERNMVRETLRSLSYAAKSRNIVNFVEAEKPQVVQKAADTQKSMQEKLAKWREKSGRAPLSAKKAPLSAKKAPKNGGPMGSTQKRKRPDSADENRMTGNSFSSPAVAPKAPVVTPSKGLKEAKKAKALVMSAKTLEDCQEHKQALELYRQALELLPGSKKLEERVQKLQAQISADEGKAREVASAGGVGAAVGSEEKYKALLQEQMANLVERQLVDILNSGDSAQLMSLHGVGSARAKKITEELESNGAYGQLCDLERIGLSEKQINKLLTQNAAGQLGIAGARSGR
jgi:kinesin family protein 22